MSWDPNKDYSFGNGPPRPTPDMLAHARAGTETDQERQIIHDFRQWQGEKNQFLEERAIPMGLFNQMGYKDVHEQGQSAYSGLRNSWRELIQSDPNAASWARQNAGWVADEARKNGMAPGDPGAMYLAYRKSQEVNYLGSPHQGKAGTYQHWEWDPTRNAYSTGGANAQYYDKYGNPVGGSRGGSVSAWAQGIPGGQGPNMWQPNYMSASQGWGSPPPGGAGGLGQMSGLGPGWQNIPGMSRMPQTGGIAGGWGNTYQSNPSSAWQFPQTGGVAGGWGNTARFQNPMGGGGSNSSNGARMYNPNTRQWMNNPPGGF